MTKFPIPLEAFREAYRVTGLKPKWRTWYRVSRRNDDIPCGCPMAALLIANQYNSVSFLQNKFEINEIVVFLRNIGYAVNTSQVVCFIAGVDAHNQVAVAILDADAFDVGVAVREQVMRPLARAIKVAEAGR